MYGCRKFDCDFTRFFRDNTMPHENETDSSKGLAQYNAPSPFTPSDLKSELRNALNMLKKRYQGKEVDCKKIPRFQLDGMKTYTNYSFFEKTDIEITVKLDITLANKIYRQNYSHTPGASFTLFLMWIWIKALNEVKGFNYRYIDGKWYDFSNLPLFTTITTDPENNELRNILIEDVVHTRWEKTCEKYLDAKKFALASKNSTLYPYPVYALATPITNLNLRFSHASAPTVKKEIEIERPMFVFGQRQEKNEQMTMPLYAKIPHASLYPLLLRKLIKCWDNIILEITPYVPMAKL